MSAQAMGDDEFNIQEARRLAEAGYPIFVAAPNPKFQGTEGEPEFRRPMQWQRTKADPAALDRWQPGWAIE